MTASFNDRHDETPACAYLHCRAHGVDEAGGVWCWLVCPGCRHRFWSARELRRAYRRTIRREARAAGAPSPSWRTRFTPTANIHACPLCRHPWEVLDVDQDVSSFDRR